MRLVILCALSSTACQAVFPREAGDPVDAPVIKPPDDGAQPIVERGASSTVRTQGALVNVPRPAGTRDTDIVVVTFQGAGQTIETEGRPTGFDTLVDLEDSCGSATWHLWVFAGPAGLASTYDFIFNGVDSFSAIAVSYSKAQTTKQVALRSSMQDAQNASVEAFGDATADPGSLGFVALAGNMAIETDPPTLGKITQFDKLAIYDEPAVDTTLPGFMVVIPQNHCIGIAEISLEP